MRILIDIGHPAHVHIFKNFAHEMEKRGHELLFTCRDKEFEIALLKHDNLRYVSFGKKYKLIVGKIWGMFKFDYLEWKTCLKFKPDILLSHGSICAAHVSFLMRRPHISFEDTYNMEQVRLYEPFTELILTGNYEHRTISKKEFPMAGYNELAYLHPNRFTPDRSVLEKLNVKEEDKYVVIRFIAFNGSHDIDITGLSFDNKMKAIKEFSKYAKVFISSEKELPPQLVKYKLPTDHNLIHHVMAFSSLVFGESGTMAEEAAMLGIPAIQVVSEETYYTRHLQNEYGLMRVFTESQEKQIKAIEYGVELLKDNEVHKEWQDKRNKMLHEKIDVTAFLIWLVENYPQSRNELKCNPEIQYQFK